MSKVFISYRRADSAGVTGRIYDRLVSQLGRDAVFKDVDDIPPGANFASYVNDVLRQCAVALVIIGPHWLDAGAPAVGSGDLGSAGVAGRPRLENPQDWVRLEVETALALGLTIIPILVEGGQVPKTSDLPDSLQVLRVTNAVSVRSNDPDFTHDMERVLAGVLRASTPLPANQAAPLVLTTSRPPRPGSFRKRIVFAVIAVCVLVAAVGYVAHHFGLATTVNQNGPATTLKQFIQDDYEAPTAAQAVHRYYPLLCSDVQATYSENFIVSRIQAGWNANEGAISDVDLSQLTYTVQDESSTQAHVRLGGYLTYVHAGTAGSFTYPNDNPADLHLLKASGHGWCLTADILASAVTGA